MDPVISSYRIHAKLIQICFELWATAATVTVMVCNDIFPPMKMGKHITQRKTVSGQNSLRSNAFLPCLLGAFLLHFGSPAFLLPVIPRCLWLQTRIQPHAFLPPILVLFCSLWTNRAHREQNSARGKNLISWISNAIRLRKMCERATKVIKDSESAHSRQAVRVSRFTIRTEMFGTACDGEMKEGQRGNKSKKAAATDILNVFQVYSNKRGFSLHGHCRCVRSQTCILAMTLILSQR